MKKKKKRKDQTPLSKSDLIRVYDTMTKRNQPKEGIKTCLTWISQEIQLAKKETNIEYKVKSLSHSYTVNPDKGKEEIYDLTMVVVYEPVSVRVTGSFDVNPVS